MGKGDQTRDAILLHALKLATKVGFEGLTSGRLADDLKLSKSGLFAHFGSKESLQVKVLELASRRFIDESCAALYGATRRPCACVRCSSTGWPGRRRPPAGGCPFTAPPPTRRPARAPRDFVVRSQHDWLETIANTARTAVQEGDFDTDLDCEQFAYELQSMMLGYAHASRLMKDPRARARTERAFEALLRRAGAAASTIPKTGARRR